MSARVFVDVGSWHVDAAEIVAWKVTASSPAATEGELVVVTKADITFKTRGRPSELVDRIYAALHPTDPTREDTTP